jgi:group II intron reverse transcriptase/maturase
MTSSDLITTAARLLLAVLRRASELAAEERPPSPATAATAAITAPYLPATSVPPALPIPPQEEVAPALFEEIQALPNLWRAWHRVRENDGAPGPDGRTTATFARHPGEELALLAAELRSGTYRPGPVLAREIPKPGQSGKTRRLLLANVRDRIVQTAVAQVLTPRLDPGFSPISFAYREGRGTQQAILTLKKALASGAGPWVVDLDFRNYFDSIPHDRLLSRLSQVIREAPLLDLIGKLLRPRILLPGGGSLRARRGVSQGSPLSPLLANFYLTPLDRILEHTAGATPLRYADDLIVLCPDEVAARNILGRIERFAGQNGLELHPEKTRLVDLRQEPVTFLGYACHTDHLAPSPQARDRLLSKVEQALRPDSSSPDPGAIEKGWKAYYRHAAAAPLESINEQLLALRLRSPEKARHEPTPAPKPHPTK